jgi:hypothetical protein
VDETIPMDESDETSHPAISEGLGSVAAKKVGGSDCGPAGTRIWEITKAWRETAPGRSSFFNVLRGLTDEFQAGRRGSS